MPSLPRRLLLIALAIAPSARAGKIQANNLALPADAGTHKQAVVNIFTSSYSNYKYAAFLCMLSSFL